MLLDTSMFTAQALPLVRDSTRCVTQYMAEASKRDMFGLLCREKRRD